MSELTDLRQRIAAADGPSRELDAEIMAAFYDRGQRHIGVQEDGPNGWESCLSEVWIDRSTGEWIGTHAKEFTASLDAAVALVERVLPGWHWEVSADKSALVRDPAISGAAADIVCWKAATPPIAILAALFMALEAKTERAPAAL